MPSKLRVIESLINDALLENVPQEELLKMASDYKIFQLPEGILVDVLAVASHPSDNGAPTSHGQHIMSSIVGGCSYEVKADFLKTLMGLTKRPPLEIVNRDFPVVMVCTRFRPCNICNPHVLLQGTAMSPLLQYVCL